MKITDQALREKILEFIKLKREPATKQITAYTITWASDSRVRDLLLSLMEEGLLTRSKVHDNATSSFYWKLVEPKELKFDLAEPDVEEFAAMEDVTAQIGNEPVLRDFQTANEELTKILKHEFNLILRKYQRRRDVAAKALQNAEATIKNLELKIRCL